MYKSFAAAIALATTAMTATAAYADEATPLFKVSGSATLTSEYRLRGISQTDSDPAIQGGITLTHESGVYLSTWASNLAGNGTFGGSNMEFDAIAGFSRGIGPVTLDAGGIYYIYPGTKGHDFFELYGSVSGKMGPVGVKVGTNWTPPQGNIGNSGGSKGNNIWVYGELGFSIPSTPVTLKGHLGYSSGDSLYTKGGAAFAPAAGGNKDILDYSVGADFAWKNLTLNVSYVGTDLDSAYANANFGAGSKTGHKITKGDIVATLTASF